MRQLSRPARGAALRRALVASVACCAIALSPVATLAQSTTSYTYDELGRLTGTSVQTTNVTYSYDAAGNRVQQVVTAAPVAGPVSITVAINSSANPVTLNFTGGSPTSVGVSTGASHGTATPSGVTITYTPTSGYSGSDTFQYTGTNANGMSAPGIVSVTVNPAAPIAGAVVATVGSNTTANPITLNLSGGIATSVAVSTGASHGTATPSGTSILYTPTTSYSGTDSFQYTATNVTGTSSPATATITVVAAPIAGAVSRTVAYNSTGNTVTPSLTGGTATSVAVSTSPTHGTASPSGLSFTYTPTTGYSGADSFQYTATNVAGTSSPATVSIAITPVAGAVTASVGQNSTSNPITLNLSGGTMTSVAVSTAASHGTATASGTSITYTPTTGYTGSDSFQYTATNGGGTSAPGTVSITVASNPTAVNDSYSMYDSVTSYVADPRTNDSDPNSYALTITSIGTPTGGTATYTGSSVTYYPTAGDGTYTLTYTISNGHGGTATATITYTVRESGCHYC
jgi:YD repeat-containing protein